MEPKLPNPEHSPDYLPNLSLPRPEIGYKNPEQGGKFEKQDGERKVERGPSVSQVAALPIPPLQPSTPALDTTLSNPLSNSTPLVANDDDLIEKEWVDKAKQVLAITKDDPYRREQEVSKLQVEYLRKRYGKDLAVPE